MDKLKKASDRILESVFPTDIYCMCCGSIIDGSRTYALCDDCIEKVHWAVGNTCDKCGKILDEGYPHPLCNDCRMRERVFDKGFTCAQYGLYERALMMDLKYRDKSYIGPKTGEILADRIEPEVCAGTAGKPADERIPVDWVVPVPLSEKRMEERGYNQAELLARPVAERIGVPLVRNGLVRKAETQAMKDLGVQGRFLNMKGAFAVSGAFEEILCGGSMTNDTARNSILLIDDIMTTGATLDACALALKKAGAGKVYVLTFAAGGNVPVPAAREAADSDPENDNRQDRDHDRYRD